VVLVPDLYIAWHAGKSSWKNFKSLNFNSIGIEISNPGHYFNYKKYSNKQINSLLNLSKFLINKYKIKSKNILGHSDIAPDRKKDPGEKFPWSFLAKKKVGLWHSITKQRLKSRRKKTIDINHKKKFHENLIKIGYLNKKQAKDKLIGFVIKAFQRRYRQELVNGKLDKECLLISENIAKKFD
jgi:N-acetylmuramoyl-L-alanine amidase